MKGRKNTGPKSFKLTKWSPDVANVHQGPLNHCNRHKCYPQPIRGRVKFIADTAGLSQLWLALHNAAYLEIFLMHAIMN